MVARMTEYLRHPAGRLDPRNRHWHPGTKATILAWLAPGEVAGTRYGADRAGRARIAALTELADGPPGTSSIREADGVWVTRPGPTGRGSSCHAAPSVPQALREQLADGGRLCTQSADAIARC